MGKHIMITGASKGIGLAIARKYAESEPGIKLSLCARDLDELRDSTSSLPTVDLFVHRCDVSDSKAVQEFVSEAELRHGTVDHLVNNAGFGIFRALAEMTVEEFDGVLATNLRGVFLVTRAVLPKMIQANHGTVITISSLAGKNGFAGGTAYCASKHAVRGLMQSMFFEVRDHNIRALTIFPGSVETAFFNPALGATRLRATKALDAEDVANAVYHVALLPESATVSELDIRPTNPKAH